MDEVNYFDICSQDVLLTIQEIYLGKVCSDSFKNLRFF